MGIFLRFALKLLKKEYNTVNINIPNSFNEVKVINMTDSRVLARGCNATINILLKKIQIFKKLLDIVIW